MATKARAPHLAVVARLVSVPMRILVHNTGDSYVSVLAAAESRQCRLKCRLFEISTCSAPFRYLPDGVSWAERYDA